MEVYQQALKRLIAFLLVLIIGWCQPGWAYDNPDLLPKTATPIIDLARILTDQQEAELADALVEFENRSGWKLRVLTQYDRTPGLSVREFWNLDERSVLLIADPRGGNLLNFNVGDALFALMPRLYWVELQTRYGNQYYVRDYGEDGSVISAVNSIKSCLDRGGCQVVPGLPKEQMIWTIITSIIGGIVAGIAAFPRDVKLIIDWKWLLLFSPLWVMLFGVFGIAPVVTRTSDIIPLARNIVIFIASAIGSYLIAKGTLDQDEVNT